MSFDPATHFKTARATYDSRLEELRPHTGQWVLIHWTEVVGIYLTWDEVAEAAWARFPDHDFYIRQIATVDILEFDLLSPRPEALHQAA